MIEITDSNGDVYYIKIENIVSIEPFESDDYNCKSKLRYTGIG
jgi:hypothetical protein